MQSLMLYFYSKIIAKCLKWAWVGALCISSLFTKAMGNENVKLEPMGAYSSALSESQVQQIKSEFILKLKELGLTSSSIAKAQYLSLEKLNQILNMDSRGRVDWQKVQSSMDYWNHLLGKDPKGKSQLDHFISKTSDPNPFKIFGINYRVWNEFINMSLTWGMFSTLDGFEIRSFRSYVLHYMSLEGVSSIESKPLGFWKQWSVAFKSSGIDPDIFGRQIWENILHTRRSAGYVDGLKNLSELLHPQLQEAFLKYPKLTSPSLLKVLSKSSVGTLTQLKEQILDIFEMQQRYSPAVTAKTKENLVQELTDLIRNHESQKRLTLKKPRLRGQKTCRSFI